MSENHHNDDKTRTHIPLLKDTMVGHYRIIEKIGSGGMGEVYLAEDIELKRKVALKFLPQHLCLDADCRARFKREAQAAASLSHPNIVTVFDVSDFQNRPFFAMEYIEGHSLREVIKEGKLTIGEAITLTIQLCEGLQEAHESGITHRDIKPSNITVDRKGRARLLDFGLAAVKGTDKLTKTGSTLGTVGYMSPEQAEGKETDQRSDLFSLGIVLYEMIAGRRPFDRESDVATSKAIVTETAEPLAKYKSGVPEGLQQIVDRALEKSLETRYQTASGMHADLKRLMSSESIALPKRKKISRPVLVLALVVLASAVVWGGFKIKHWLSQPQASAKSIAVVDFDNVGSEDDAYLASGLAEDLSIKLRQLEGVQVASSSDIRRLARENLLPREIAARLKVQYALGGSLLRQDSLVRVNVELIDRESGKVVWSDQINRQFTEIFQFLDDVSFKIAQALEVRLTPVEKAAMAARSTDNTIAYDHYLKGRHYYYNITFRDNELAEKEFERALQSDPDYPLAFAGLADVFVQRYKERFDYDEYWLDSAKMLIERSLTLEPNLAEAYESRAELYLEEDNITGALESAEKARNIQPDWDEPYIHLGNIFTKKGFRDTALAFFNTALELRPSIDALCGKGDIFLIRGQFDSAQTVYQLAAKLNPHHYRPWHAMATLAEDLGHDEEMEQSERRAILSRPDHAEAYLWLAVTLFNKDSIQEGEQLLRGFVKDYPYNYEGYDGLYQYLAWWKGDYSEAFKVVNEAVSRNPDRVWPHLLLASSYIEKMSPAADSTRSMPMSDEVIEAVERALGLRPNSGRVLEWAGALYIDLNRPEVAMEYFERAKQARPGSSDLLVKIASHLTQIREFELAVEYGLRAIKLCPGNSDNYYYSLRPDLIRLGREREWYDIVSTAAARYGDDPAFLILLSREQRVRGDYAASITSAQRALQKKNTPYWMVELAISKWMNGNADDALELFRKASAHWVSAHAIVAILKSEGRFREIASYLRSIKSYQPGVNSGWDEWTPVAARHYMSMRRFDEALAVYREYRQSGKETWSIENSLTMAECYRRKGDLDGARKLLEPLLDSSLRIYRPFVLVELAELEAIQSSDLSHAIAAVNQALAEYDTPNDWATTPMASEQLRLCFAAGRMGEVRTQVASVSPHWVQSQELYRRYQLANAVHATQAETYRNEALRYVSRQAHGELIYASSIGLLTGEACSYYALLLARSGKPADARRQIERALKFEPEREDIAYNAACAYSLLGDTTLALQWLQTAVDRGYLELWWAKVDPDLDPLRNLPRFKEIMNDWDSRIRALVAKSGRNI